MKVRTRVLMFAVSTTLVLQAHAATYSIVELGTLGGVHSDGNGLNSRGDVVGSIAFADGRVYPFLYDANGMRYLPIPGGATGRAMAINDNGTIAGAVSDGVRDYLSIWRNGRWEGPDLGRADVRTIEPHAIGNSDIVVGQLVLTGSGAERAFQFENGNLRLLPSLGGAVSVAYGIDDLGRTVGGATNAEDAQLRAVMWTSDGIVDLGTVGGRVAAAHSLNARGQIVGDSLAAENYARHAFLYENGVMRDLLPDPTKYSDLKSINAIGDAVGSHHLYRGGRLTPWSELVNPYTSWELEIRAMNDAGLIMGNGYRTGKRRAIFLVPLKPPPPPPEGQVNVIEYHHAGLGHFFMTALASEIEALDSGAKPGWERTGEWFRAYPRSVPGTSAVCRFYIPPPYGDSHFFSASPKECAETRAKFPELILETAEAAYIAVPDASGSCAAGTIPVYRLWSQSAGSNHRYTTDPGVRDNMTKAGWTAEGDGPDRTNMCAPA